MIRIHKTLDFSSALLQEANTEQEAAVHKSFLRIFKHLGTYDVQIDIDLTLNNWHKSLKLETAKPHFASHNSLILFYILGIEIVWNI